MTQEVTSLPFEGIGTGQARRVAGTARHCLALAGLVRPRPPCERGVELLLLAYEPADVIDANRVLLVSRSPGYTPPRSDAAVERERARTRHDDRACD